MALISVSNNALQNITAVPASIPSGALILIKSITASSSASIEFINGTDGVVLDGTYSSYVFKFIDIHPQTNAVLFEFNISSDNGVNYNVVKTTTAFRTLHNESDSTTALTYMSGDDLAQSTSWQALSIANIGNDADQTLVGTFTLYNPSSTVFVKHFISNCHLYTHDDFAYSAYVAGYGNTTSAINAIKFQLNSGNIDDGIIKLYGVK